MVRTTARETGLIKRDRKIKSFVMHRMSFSPWIQIKPGNREVFYENKSCKLLASCINTIFQINSTPNETLDASEFALLEPDCIKCHDVKKN
jgi:hypothetical protein